MEIMKDMRDLALYPSTKAPRGHFIVVAIDVLTGVAWIVHTCPVVSSAWHFTDVKNFCRKDALDPYFVAFDEKGEIMRDLVNCVIRNPNQKIGLAL